MPAAGASVRREEVTMPDPKPPAAHRGPGAARRPFPFRPVAIAVAALVIVIAGAWIALLVSFPPARLRALLEGQASRTLGREVRLEGVSLSLWPPIRITVTAPAMAEAGGFRAGTMASAKWVHLDLDLFALLARRLVARRLEVSEPQVHMVLRPDGTTNFEGPVGLPAPGAAPGGPGGAPPLDLLVREFRLRKARVQIDDRRAHRRVVFGLDSRLGFSAE